MKHIATSMALMYLCNYFSLLSLKLTLLITLLFKDKYIIIYNNTYTKIMRNFCVKKLSLFNAKIFLG